MAIKHKKLMKWHIWLGWLIGIPLILWAASALFMVARPIEEVRGNHLRAEQIQTPMTYETIVMFADSGDALTGARLITQGSSRVWVVNYEGGAIMRYDAVTGKAMAHIDRKAAKAAADAVYLPEEQVKSIRYFAADNPPSDLRREKASWQVHFADGTNIYVDALTGETLAVRTEFWRAFDFMWGLHIMDPQMRGDTSQPILIGFAALALLGSVLGFIMLFTRRKKRSRNEATI